MKTIYKNSWRGSLVLLSLLIGLASCSSVETKSANVSLGTIQSTDRIQLLVRSGNAAMDHQLYELAYQQFSDVLPLREKEPYTGALEVTFTSAGQSSFVGSTTTVGSGTGWYSGNNYAGQVGYSGSSSSISSGGVFEWQNSVMLMVLKRSDGERLWSADYNYKGGWEMSGWVVNTPEEAARLVTRRLKDRFVADFKHKT